VKTVEGVSEGPRKARTMHTVHPFSSANYAWELPAESNKRLKIIANGRERLVDVMEIGVLAPFRFTDVRFLPLVQPRLLPKADPSCDALRQRSGNPRIASLDVRAEGPSQLLVITNYEESHSAFKPTGRGTLSRTSTMDSNVAFEAVPTDTSVNMTISVDFEGVGISVVNKRMQELVYMSFRGLELRYVDTATSYSASVNCKWIQIDNQLFGGIYPIIFYPSVAPKDGKDLDSHPTLQSSVIVLKDESASALYLCLGPRSLADRSSFPRSPRRPLHQVCLNPHPGHHGRARRGLCLRALRLFAV
jgi:vacuolar protein sorting-associated protein 13A/C